MEISTVENNSISVFQSHKSKKVAWMQLIYFDGLFVKKKKNVLRRIIFSFEHDINYAFSDLKGVKCRVVKSLFFNYDPTSFTGIRVCVCIFLLL